MAQHALVLAIALGLCGCAAPSREGEAEARSLLGEPLYRPVIDGPRRAEVDQQLREARAMYDADPTSEQNVIWFGRRLAYAGRFKEAVDVYSKGVDRLPRSYRLLRHRGHRLITLRRFDDALRDLALAAELCVSMPDELEPDGVPNASGVPRSTDRSNIFYHHGLVLYLMGRWEESDAAFARRLSVSAFNDDMVVSMTHWRYLALRRSGRDRDANHLLESVREGMDIRENHGYYRLCLYYQGKISEDEALGRSPDGRADAGVAYGVAAVRLLNGDRRGGIELLEEAVRVSPWTSFGHIAAEADLARFARKER